MAVSRHFHPRCDRDILHLRGAFPLERLNRREVQLFLAGQALSIIYTPPQATFREKSGLTSNTLHKRTARGRGYRQVAIRAVRRAHRQWGRKRRGPRPAGLVAIALSGAGTDHDVGGRHPTQKRGR
jgi:hypothetical protein